MSSKNIFLVIFILMMIALIAGMLFYKKPKPTQTPVVATSQQPTPVPTIDPNALPVGNDNNQLDQDSVALDQKMSSLDADLQNVDTGLSDKQTNLQ